MLRPLRDRIVVRPIMRQASSIIAAIHSELPTEGEVVAVGPGKVVKGRLRPLDTKVGDRIRFGEGSYLKFPEYWHGNEKFLVLQEADVAGIVGE
jgi:chaperonin GroES